MAYGASDYNSVDDRLAKMKGSVYKAQAAPQSMPEYDYARKKVVEQSSQANSEAQDALKRRYAAMGALNSGSAIKQQQLQNDSSERNKNEALLGIGAQEAAAKREFAQQEAMKEFQSQEASAGRGFQAQESQLGRDLQKSLAMEDMEFKKWATNLSNNTALKQLDLQYKQLDVDKFNSLFNAVIAGKKEGISGGGWGSLGVDMDNLLSFAKNKGQY